MFETRVTSIYLMLSTSLLWKTQTSHTRTRDRERAVTLSSLTRTVSLF